MARFRFEIRPHLAGSTASDPALVAAGGFRYWLDAIGFAVVAALVRIEASRAERFLACSITFLLAAQWLQHSAGFIVLGPDGILSL